MIHVLKWLFPYWMRYRRKIVLILFLGLASALIRVAAPYIIKNIVDGFKINPSREYILLNALLIILLGILGYVTAVAAQGLRAWMNMRLEWIFRQETYEHILGLDNTFFSRYSGGDLVTRFIDDISEKISWFACSGVFRFVQAFLTLSAVLAAMFHMNARLAFWVILPLPFIALLSVKTGKLLIARFNALQGKISEVYDFLESSFSGIKVIKANSKEIAQSGFFDAKAAEQMRAEIDAGKLGVVFSYFFHSSSFVLVILIYLVGGAGYMEGKLSMGELVAFQAYAQFMLYPLMTISQFFIQGGKAKVSISRIEELLDFRPQVRESGDPQEPGKTERIDFEDVSAGIGGREILKAVSFSAFANEKVAVVGKIGSGKTTLMRLLPRFMDPAFGKIKINGVDVRRIPLKSLRRKIGYVPQEPAIFSDTIYNNIAMGNPAVTVGDIKKALRISRLEKDLEKFPRGLSTSVGTRGLSISGGQKQRIQIARALATRPEILILDDVTSAMDAETEEEFWRELENAFPGILCFAVTHRPRTIAASDRIILLHEGRVAASGSHDSLIKKSALYRDLYEKEKIEEELRRKKAGET